MQTSCGLSLTTSHSAHKTAFCNGTAFRTRDRSRESTTPEPFITEPHQTLRRFYRFSAKFLPLCINLVTACLRTCPRLSALESSNVPSILLMIRSAHCTADSISDSVRGLERQSCNSSVFFKCRAIKIPATVANTRFPPSSIRCRSEGQAEARSSFRLFFATRILRAGPFGNQGGKSIASGTILIS